MGKRVLRFLALTAITFVGCWAVIQYKVRNAPAGLGVTNGELAACPDTPNCVSSDTMPPLQFEGEVAAAKAAVKDALKKKEHRGGGGKRELRARGGGDSNHAVPR